MAVVLTPSNLFNSVAEAVTAASFVKSACTNPDTLFSKLISSAVELTAASFVKSAWTKPETPSSKFNSVALEVTAASFVKSLVLNQKHRLINLTQ